MQFPLSCATMATVHDDGEGNVADGEGHRTLETVGYHMTAKKCETTVAWLARNVPAVYRTRCSIAASAKSRYETLPRACSLVCSVEVARCVTYRSLKLCSRVT